MYPFFETLRIEERKVHQLEYHQKRIGKTFKVFYPEFEPIDLKEVFQDFPPEKEKTKCKLSYNSNFFTFECSPYQEQIHQAFKIIPADGYDYSFKYTKRDFFNDHKNKYPEHELIFTKNGKITDTTYSNLVFEIKGRWFTPKTCLLKGTQRDYLLTKKKISKMDIDINELRNIKKFKLINALLDLENSTEYYTDMIEF